jgi:hypothetical protein
MAFGTPVGLPQILAAMPVQFVCPHCTQLLSVGSRKIGTAVACPRCRRDVIVPDQEAASVSVAMRQAQKEPPEAPLPEFMVYDEPPAAELDAPPIIITDTHITRLAAPPARKEPRPEPATSPLWQKLPGQREPMLLLSRRALFLQAGILAAMTLVAFGLGYLVGFEFSPTETAGPSAQAGEATLVQGFVRYTANDGQVRGDGGSVVIALPDGRLPTPKLGVQGLRPGDAAPVPGGGVLMSLELLGGAMSRVADDGSYSLPVPEPGRYFLLFISRNAQRSAGSQPDEFQLALMQRYFQPADELIGGQKYLWRVESLPGGATSRSHDFGASGVD